jgi:hypothetical protein
MLKTSFKKRYEHTLCVKMFWECKPAVLTLRSLKWALQSDGVTAAQQILVLFVLVRIQVGLQR